MSFVINWKTHLKCTFLSFLITIVFYNQFCVIVGNFLDYSIFEYPSLISILIFYICVILIMIPLSIFHELIHGITFKLFGGKVVYGFRWIYAYTQEISGKAIKRNKFLLVLVMPLTIISVLCLIIDSRIFNMIFLLNLLGSSGDIFMALTLVKYNCSSLIIDRKYGYDVVFGK